DRPDLHSFSASPSPLEPETVVNFQRDVVSSLRGGGAIGSRGLTIVAGFPAASTSGGMSPLATLPAPTIVLAPTLQPGSKMARAAIQAPSPTVMGRVTRSNPRLRWSWLPVQR